MATRIAINGFGRIGRNVVRAIYESGRKDIDVVAINDLGPVETNAHLMRFDSVHGRFPKEVTVDGDTIKIEGGDSFKVFAERDPADELQRKRPILRLGSVDDRQEHEHRRQRETVVQPRLDAQQVPDAPGNLLASDDRRGKHGVSRSENGGDPASPRPAGTPR